MRKSLIVEMREVGDRIKELDEEIRVVEAELARADCSRFRIFRMRACLWALRRKTMWKFAASATCRAFDFEPKAHWEIAQELGILDFEARRR